MKTKHKSGFSLIEIMVAVIILVVLALGGAAVMYQTGGNIQIQGNKRIASEIANEVLEQEKVKDYMGIITPSKEFDSKVVDGIQHDISIVRTRHGVNIANVYKRIDVSVTYRGGTETVSLSTMVSFGN